MRTIAYALLVPVVSLAPSFAFAQTDGPSGSGSVTFGAGAGASTESAAPGATGAATATGETAAGATAPAAASGGAATASKSESSAERPAAEGGDADQEQRAWAERDRKLNESMTLSGGVGLLRTQHAQSGAPGQFRLAFTTEYFSAGFLCTADFPCRNPTGGRALTSDSLDHIGGTIGLTATILPWLEGYATTGAFANSDASNRPSLLQVLGDTNFGLKAFGAISSVLHAGGAMELWLVNGTGSVGLDGSGTGAKFRGLGTVDLRGMEKPVPLRFSLNLTYSVDNSGDVLVSTEASRGQPVTRIERFGLNVNRVDHFDVNLGGEFFAAEDRVRPFIEYSLMAPVNRQGYLCRPSNPSGDHCLANDTIAPSRLTLGSRFFPWKRGFGLTAALDIGVTGVGTFIEEVAPTPPWTLFLGAGWAVDTWDRPPVEKVKVVEKLAGSKFKAIVHGTVREKDAQEVHGVADAIVAWGNHPDWTSLATSAEGKFNTRELADGEYHFAIRAEGYKDGECAATIEGQKDVNVECPLEALPRMGVVIGHVRDADGNAPIPNATIKITDSKNKEATVTADSQGGYRFEQIPPGTAQVSADAEGYLTVVVPTDVKPRADNGADIQLKKRPKNPLVQVQGKEITIKQQIQFALDSAVILPESSGLLTEIADVILKNPRIKRIEVQGHTDNTGPADHNRQLSDDRANSVKNWLVQHGVSADRLMAKGYGDTRPIAPNVTEAMKARNRRVQFIILDRDAAAPAPDKAEDKTDKKGTNAPLPVPMPF
jgi:OmpA-OmpF porin, OOP family